MQETVTKTPQKSPVTFKSIIKAITSQKGWLFILPAMILMVIFTFYPIVNALISAFKVNYSGLTGSFDGWGFDNFKSVIESSAGVAADFGTCLINTLIFAFISVPVSTILALLISVALNSIKTLQKAYQTIFFLPYLTNSLAMGAVFATFFNIVGTNANVETYGLVNNILMLFGGEPINWINAYALGEGFNYWTGRFVVVFFEIWSGLPFKILIIFSALQAVNKQYYDAARVDSATKATILWKITVPLISPTLSYLLITGIMGGLKSYSAIVGLFGENMGPTGDFEMGTMVGYIYKCIDAGKTGLASAGSLILFGIIMIFTVINLYISNKKVHY